MWASTFGLPSSVFAGFLLAALAPRLARKLKHSIGKFVAVLPLSLTLFFAFLLSSLSPQAPLRSHIPWSEYLGVSLSFSLDGLSGLFALIICFVGALIMVYAGDYLHGRSEIGRFYALLLAFMASMLGVVLSDNLISLFVFWELTSLSSFLLIGFEHEHEKARKSALQALLVTSIGGLAMLAGFLVLGGVAGTYEISLLLKRGDEVRASAAYLPALLLILAGAFTKSAQFPFHFWLPNAMSAPTPVSAYLHSATMVKAGIYLLARLSPVLSTTPSWFYLVGGTGAVTMLVGSVLALGQTDLKLLLAYMTVMALGALTMLLGIGSSIAIKAAVVFLMVHSLYKGALFLVAGSIDHGTGTRDILQLGSLAKKMPALAAVTVVAALSMAGLPPLLGFVGKELVYKAALNETGASALAFIVAAVFAKATAVTISAIVAFKPFFQKRQDTAAKAMSEAQGPSFGMILGPLVLATLGLVFGLWPGLISSSLVAPAVKVISGSDVGIELHAWPELNVATLLSGISIAVGCIGFVYWPRILPKLQLWIRRIARFGAGNIYEQSLIGMQGLAGGQTNLLQCGALGLYIGVIAIVVTIGISPSPGDLFEVKLFAEWSQITFYEWILAGLIGLGSIYSIFARSMLGAFASLGITGYAIALIYVLHGAPDLALTQIFVETLTIVLATLVIGRVIEFPAIQESRCVVIRDAVISCAFGAALAMQLSAVLTATFDPYLSEYFSENSVPGGFGRNIVNVILVDFRAIDTLGEITVIAIAAFGIHALLKTRIKQEAER